jgi:hypothetical protein
MTGAPHMMFAARVVSCAGSCFMGLMVSYIFPAQCREEDRDVRSVRLVLPESFTHA